MNFTQFLESLDPEDLIDFYEHVLSQSMVAVLLTQYKGRNHVMKKMFIDSIYSQTRKRMRLVHGSCFMDGITNDFMEKNKEMVSLIDKKE